MQNLAALLFQNTSLRQTVAKNTFWLFLGQTITRLLKFFLIAYAARVLGAAGYGSFSFALSFIGLTFLFSDLGLGALLVREYAKGEFEKYAFIANSFYLKIIVLACSAAVAAVAFPFVHDPAARSVIFLLAIFYVFDSLREFFISVVRAAERMEREAVILAVEAIATTLLGIAVLRYAPGLANLSLAYVMGAGLALVLSFTLAYPLLPWPLTRPRPTLMWQLLSLAWPFALGSATGFILASTDTVMLGLFKNPEAVGHYAAGSKVVQLMFLGPAFLGLAVLPAFSAFHNDKKKLLNISNQVISFLGMLAIPTVVGGLLSAPRFIPAVFGEQYRASIIPFQILIFVLPLFFFVVLWDYLLLAVNLQIKDMQYTAVAAVANVLFNAVLIPWFGVNGAALATVLAQGINFMLTFFLARNFLGANPMVIRALQHYLAAAFIMALFMVTPLGAALPIFVLIPTAAALYFCALLVLRTPMLKDVVDFSLRQ